VAVRAEGACDPIKIGVGDDVRELFPGDRFSFELAGAPARG
jgi:hypothetical protein